jgi:hypothetical protein
MTPFQVPGHVDMNPANSNCLYTSTCPIVMAALHERMMATGGDYHAALFWARKALDAGYVPDPTAVTTDMNTILPCPLEDHYFSNFQLTEKNMDTANRDCDELKARASRNLALLNRKLEPEWVTLQAELEKEEASKKRAAEAAARELAHQDALRLAAARREAVRQKVHLARAPTSEPGTASQKAASATSAQGEAIAQPQSSEAPATMPMVVKQKAENEVTAAQEAVRQADERQKASDDEAASYASRIEKLHACWAGCDGARDRCLLLGDLSACGTKANACVASCSSTNAATNAGLETGAP